MKASATKNDTSHHSNSSTPFFSNKEEGGFFSKYGNPETPFFSSEIIQRKCDVCDEEDDLQKKQNPVSEMVQKQEMIQMSPDVNFNVNSLTRVGGMLDDPSDDGTNVTFPLSFSVNSPISVDASVDVNGGAGAPCSGYQVGFLQTVHSQWLHMYYWGRRRGHGRLVTKANVNLPIRDGDPSTFWYTDSAHEGVASCGGTVTPHMDDYPTIFDIQKVETNTITGEPNYLTGIIRGMHFVVFLVATDGTRFIPLKHFYWNYWMDIRFRPNYSHPTAVWPFDWRKNRASIGGVINGGSRSIPMFTTATTPYNHALSLSVHEYP